MKQLTQRKVGSRISLALTVLLAVGTWAASSPVSADISATVTSVTGDASIGAKPAELSGLVSEGENIETGPEASCSLLVDQRSLVQFCGQASVRLRHDEERNATILDVSEGSTRALVGPRSAGEPLEIHTPVAIASILGTILSVTVDPATGDSTFALEEGEVQIQTQTRDPALSRTITLRAGEQVTIRADQLPGEVQRLKLQDLARRADCLDDRFFHGASLEVAREDRARALTDEITRADIPSDLPPVGAPPTVPLEPPGGVDEPLDPIPDDPCGLGDYCTGGVDPLDLFDEDGDGRIDEGGSSQEPPRCWGIPGEHCK